MKLLENFNEKENIGFSTSNRSPIKIMIVGDSGVGKTSLGERIAYSKSFRSYPMTIGVNFMTKKVLLDNKENELFLIIDAAGQSRFERIRETFYSGVHYFIAVCDLTRKKSLENLENIWIPEILRMHNGSNIPIQIIGNKSDLEELVVITLKDLEEMADKIKKENNRVSIIMPSKILSVKEDIYFDQNFGLKTIIKNL